MALIPTTPNTNPQPTGQGMTYDQVENIWIQAGGNPQAAAMAAAVADAESGLNPSASRSNPDGTTGIGLWLIPKSGMPPGTTDPVANARAAVQISQNGQDWSNWCSTWSDNNCGVNQGTYLGEGANALASLGQRLTPASYNVAGSAPSGTGVGASSATSTNPTGTSTSSKTGTFILIGATIIAVMVVVLMVRRRSAKPAVEPGPESGPTSE
jgi:hypothetical protein